MLALLLFIAGLAVIFVGLFMLVPVLVNFPDSWFGAVLMVALFVIGGGLIRRAAIERRHNADAD